MRKKILGLLAVTAAIVAPVVVASPPASASYCTSQLPAVCTVYNGAAGVACRALAKYADCIE